MSNSTLVSYTRISPNKSEREHVIDTITPHCFVGQVTAKRGADYFAETDRDASANYVIGYDGSISLSVPEKYCSWCSSNRANDNRAVTIEVACEAKHPYAVTDKAYKALIELMADICKRNGIKKLVWSTSKDERVNHKNGCNITVHRDYDNKACPGEYLYSRMGQIANEVNAKLGTTSQSATKQTAAKTTKAKDKNIAAFQKWLNSYYKSGLTVDGIYGAKTKAAAVKAFQTYANAKLGLKLKVNGAFDKDTKAAASKLNVKIGSVNRIVRIAQGMLYCKGYNAGGFDGIFGTGMRKAVKRYQSANGLTSDGIVGSNTFAKLFA